MDNYLLLKYCWKQRTLLLPIPGPNHFQKLIQIQDFKRVLDLNCK